MTRILLTTLLLLQITGPIEADAKEAGTTSREVEGLRVWTNKEGRNIEASLVRFFFEKEDDKRVPKVTLKLKAGKEVTIPAETLSDDNQNELKTWLKTNPFGMGRPQGPYIWPSYYQGSNSPDIEFIRFDESRKAYLYRTRHFDFYIDKDISKSTVSQCVAVFDTIVEALDSLPLQLDAVPRGDRPRFEALLVATKESYYRNGGIPNSGGVFMPSKNLTMIPFSSLGIVQRGNKWVFDGSKRNFEVLLHELTHHSTSHWRGMPPWFEEGLADYMSVMPYRSGRILFTNPGNAVALSIRDYKKTRLEPYIFPKNTYQMLDTKTLFNLDRRTWNGGMGDPLVSSRNYSSSMALMYYFMHEDGDRDGSHLIQWMHAWRAAAATRQFDQYDALVEEHLLRGRSHEELEEDIRSAMTKKGVRINFSGHRTLR